MSRTLIFVAEFTKSKVKTTPANAPTIDIADMLAPSASLLVSGGSPTQLTNMTGVYIYSYSAADGVLPVGLMRTADTTVDLQDVPSFPIAFSPNGLVKSSLYGILGTLLTESGAGYLAAGFKKLLDIAAPIFTLASANQSADNDTKLTTIQGVTDQFVFTTPNRVDASVPASSDPWSVALPNGYVAGEAGFILGNLSSATFPVGANEVSWQILNSVTMQPIDGARVWISTDIAGTNVIWSGQTNAFGYAINVNNEKPFLDDGTYYGWVKDSGYTDTNPTVLNVS